MPHQLPDTVRVSQWPRVGLLSCDSGQHLAYGWSMPRTAFKCSLQLVEDSIYLRHLDPFGFTCDAVSTIRVSEWDKDVLQLKHNSLSCGARNGSSSTIHEITRNNTKAVRIVTFCLISWIVFGHG
jgi:hypothetical protein